MALRHLLIFLLPFTLFSAPLDFKACQLKYQVSSIKIGNTQAFAVDKDYVLFYSKEEPLQAVVKRDPFLGLNLIKSPQNFKHIFKFYNNEPKELAGVLPQKVIEGKLLSEQIGLNALAQFSKPLETNALISGTCCGIIGLSTPTGIIDKDYIRHFLESKEIIYSDIGIRLIDKEGVRVAEVNPFFEDSPFALDDVIVQMNGKKALSAAQISKKILFSKPGTIHTFLIIRDKKQIQLQGKMHKSLSGGLVPDSFFDLFGLELDENLLVKTDSPKYEIKEGDRLLQVMGKQVSTLLEIRHLLSREKQSKEKVVVLLFRRSGFDFFIHFPKP